MDQFGKYLWDNFELPDGVHDIRARIFFKNILGADEKVMNLLEKGILIDEKYLPLKYAEANNRSARVRQNFCLEKTLEYIEKGSISEVGAKPKYINPLSVAEKEDYETGNVKLRLVIDLSRSLNLYQKEKKFKPDELDKLQSIFSKGDFCVTMDLRSAYHHLEINPRVREYFGFQIFDFKLNRFRYFTFNKMPFGFSIAGYLLSRITNPIMRLCRANGIRVGLFIDDIIVLGHSYEECKSHSNFVKNAFLLAGFSLSLEKCNFEPSQTTLYQGFCLDFKNFTYSIPPKKLEFILNKVDQVLETACRGEPIRAKVMASVIGKVLATRKARGNSILVGMRHNQHCMAKAVLGGRGPEADPDWGAHVQLDQQCIDEWRYIRQILLKVVCRTIPCAKPIPVFTLNEYVFYDQPDFEIERQLRVMASDASEAAAFIYEAEKFSIVQEFHFTEKEKELGSGRRELLSLLKTLTYRGEEFKNIGPLYWLTDSLNVFYFLKRGSRHALIQNDIMKLKILELNLGCEIIPVWQPRSQYNMVLADLGSKMFLSSDEWSIDKTSFHKICHSFGLKATIDGFATRENSLLPRFFSKIPQVGTLGVNFFATRLSIKEVYWLQPPVDLVSKTIRFILQSKLDILAIVSFPEWPLSLFWPVVVHGDRFAPFVRAAVYGHPVYSKYNEASSIFEGKKRFRHISILINTRFRDNNLRYLGPDRSTWPTSTTSTSRI